MNLVKIKQSVRYPKLYVHKYSNKVFYKNLWDDNLKELRGKVCLEDGTVVVNPFTKIFNRNENNTDIHIDEICLEVGKINGFMAAATYVKEVDEVVISTTGSLDSDFVTLAEEWVTPRIKEFIKDHWAEYTLLFEIVDPSDPHIVPEIPGAYLIGIRRVETILPYYSTPHVENVLDGIAEKLCIKRPSWRIASFKEILHTNKETDREGVVVYGQSSKTVLKLKSPHYTALKAAARIKDISKLDKRRVDEEFYPLVDYLLENREEFEALPEQERLNYIRNKLNDRV